MEIVSVLPHRRVNIKLVPKQPTMCDHNGQPSTCHNSRCCAHTFFRSLDCLRILQESVNRLLQRSSTDSCDTLQRQPWLSAINLVTLCISCCIYTMHNVLQLHYAWHAAVTLCMACCSYTMHGVLHLHYAWRAAFTRCMACCIYTMHGVCIYTMHGVLHLHDAWRAAFTLCMACCIYTMHGVLHLHYAWRAAFTRCMASAFTLCMA